MKTTTQKLLEKLKTRSGPAATDLRSDPEAAPTEAEHYVAAARENVLCGKLASAFELASFALFASCVKDICDETDEGLARMLWSVCQTKIRYKKAITLDWMREAAHRWMLGQEKAAGVMRGVKQLSVAAIAAEREVYETKRGAK